MLAKLGPNSSTGDLPKYVRRSFKGSVRFVQLPRGFRLFTLSQKRHLTNPRGRDRGEVTQWWSPFKTYKGDPGYQGRLDVADAARVAPLDLFKDMGAYANEKAGLRYLVVARLQTPCWAAFGRIRRQGALGVAATHSPKTGFQFYIPGLEERLDIKRVSAIDMIDRNAQDNAAAANAAEAAAVPGA
jgi:hypothetical protein